MSKRQAVVTGVFGAGFFLVLVVVAVLAARPAQGQYQPAAWVVGGGLDGGRWAYRVWSDGRVEVNDAGGQTGNGNELFKGWREVK